jgi:hypothetical protein
LLSARPHESAIVTLVAVISAIAPMHPMPVAQPAIEPHEATQPAAETMQ